MYANLLLGVCKFYDYEGNKLYWNGGRNYCNGTWMDLVWMEIITCNISRIDGE